MADKAKKKPAAAKQAASADAAERPRGSRKMLIAAALMCVVSLGGGFFLARAAYVKDAEAFEPEYKSEEADQTDTKDDHADAEDHGKDDHAKDEGDAEDHADDTKAASTGLIDLGEMLTNIQGFDQNGTPTSAFLKVNLMVAYRPDAGADKLMVERQPFMRDLFNGYLRGLTENDVRGMAGILYIKAELLKRARAAVGSDLPQEILIKDLIVQ